MRLNQAIVTGALVIASQLRGVNAWAYALGVTETYFCDNFGDCEAEDQAQCFSDAPNTCGNCGIQEGTVYNTDITDPSVYENDVCGDPCVTYDSGGLSMDDIKALDTDAAAGTLTVASSGETMNCKKLQSTDCAEFGVFGNVENTMYVVCDPGI